MGHPLEYQDGAEVSHEIGRIWPGWRELPKRPEQAAAADRYLNEGMVEGISDRYHLDPAEKSAGAADGRFHLAIGPVLFHSGKMSLQADGLMKIMDRPFLYMSPEDAERLGAAEGDRVRLRSDRGQVEVAVKIDAKYPPGMVFFPESFNQPPVKDLLTVEPDKASHVPVFKTAEVTIEKI
jgi:anaerobic selenocysteine-containing dehydrogenase